MSRWCKECGHEIMGRSDKVFCDDACRSLFHNKRLAQERRSFYGINSILRRNRKILQEYAGIKECRLSKKELNSKGFHFSYFTHRKAMPNGWVNFCYDLGYIEREEGVLEIISDQELILDAK